MYDYMKALQKRFDRQSHPELDTQVKSAQEELRRDMDAAVPLGRIRPERPSLDAADGQNAFAGLSCSHTLRHLLFCNHNTYHNCWRKAITFSRKVLLIPATQNVTCEQERKSPVDPHHDPRTEKTGRKQRRKAYLRVRKSRGKPALFSQNSAEGIPIESSHA